MNSDSNENSKKNLDSRNNFISIMMRGSNSNSDASSSNWRWSILFPSWWKENNSIQ